MASQTEIIVGTDAYEALGPEPTGALKVTCVSGQIEVAISTSVPLVTTAGDIVKNNESANFEASTTDSVWARARNATAIVSYASIVVAGTGGGGGGGGDASAANQGITNTRLGDVAESAPVSDTASSGLNGRLQRIAQRLTSIISFFYGQGSATSGQVGPLLQAAVKSAAPSYTDAQTQPLSLDTFGNLRTVSSGGGSATAANQTTIITELGSLTETAPVADTGSSGLNGRLQRIAQRITSLIALLPSSIGQKTMADSLSVSLSSDHGALPLPTGAATDANQTTISTGIGGLTETAPATDTASSGLNGRLQRLAQRLTSLIGLFYTQGSSTSGQVGNLTLGAVTTGAPSYTTGQTSALSIDPSGNLRVAGSIVGGGDATAANQATAIAQVGGLTETAPATDTASSGLNGRLQRIAQRLTSLIGFFYSQGAATSGQAGALVQGAVTTTAPSYTDGQTSPFSIDPAGNLRVAGSIVGGGDATAANQATQITATGGLTETAPATDTASSGLNGRLQRIAQRITSLIALIPTSLGQKTMAGSFAVTIASDQALAVTANAGSNLNTSALALNTSVSGVLLAQASTTAGQTGPLVQGAVTTAAPSYTTATTRPLSVDTAGNLRVTGGSSDATAANQTTIITELGALTETAPATDTASSGLNGRLQRIAQRLTSLIAFWYAQGSTTSGQVGSLTLGAVTTGAPTYSSGQSSPLSVDTAGNLRIVGTISGAGDASAANQVTTNTALGGVTETAPASDTASSGLNGRLQRIAQRLTSLIALLPVSIGQKANAGSVSVVLSSDHAALPLPTGAATAALQTTAAAQGSTTASQTGPLVQAAVTTAAPSYTTATTRPLSVDTAGNLRVSGIAGASATFGSAFPSAGTAIGLASGGNMVSATGDGLGNLNVAIQAAIPAGTNNIGTVSAALTNPSSILVRLATNTNAYANNDLIATSETAGSIVVPSFTATASVGDGFMIRRLRLHTNVTTGWSGALLRVRLWKSNPTYTNGDNGAYAVATGSAHWLATFEFTLEQFSDGAVGNAIPKVGFEAGIVLPGGTSVFWDLQDMDATARTPISGQNFTLTAEDHG